jgi:tetratricopeptide (TPR) repeat protein
VRGAGEPAKASLSLLRDINDERGVSLDIGYFDAAIDENPQDPAAIYLRGLAHFTLGNIETAILDFDMSYTLGLRLAEVRAHQAYSLLKSDNLNAVAEAAQRANALHAIVQSDPANALLHTYYAAFQVLLRNNALALDSLEQATLLDPDLGLAHLVRGKLFLSSGLNDSAKEVFENSEGLSLPTAQDYADRGEIYAFFGEFELAFSDLDQAIRINPNRAKSYNARARAYATFSDFPSAIADFDAAIRIDSMFAEYLINRGIVYDILGEIERSLADFEAARSLGEVVIPLPYFRNSSYFAAYAES